jgi:hypothetical protein
VDSQLLFDRIAILRVGPNGGDGKEFRSQITSQDPTKPVTEGFRIGFRIEKDTSSTVNKAEVRIYNLAEASRGYAEKTAKVVELLAGYGSTPKVIFRGDIGRCISTKEGSDVITKFEIGDGMVAYQQSRLDLSFKAGTTIKDIFDSLVGALGLTKGDQANIPNKTFLRGLSLSGPARDHLDYLTQKFGLEWSVQNGAVQIVQKNSTTSETAFLLSPNTGLIGSPNKKIIGVEVLSLLQPDLNPGRLIQIQSKLVNGNFRAEKVVHEGDTVDLPWYTRVEAA